MLPCWPFCAGWGCGEAEYPVLKGDWLRDPNLAGWFCEVDGDLRLLAFPFAWVEPGVATDDARLEAAVCGFCEFEPNRFVPGIGGRSPNFGNSNLKSFWLLTPELVRP